jgi:rhodanese-related sulfurtransferase
MVLDVRTAEEYEVSHLPGAIRDDPEGDLPEFLRLSTEAPGCYCHVYRSSRLVERLKKEGFVDARTSGSIFGWAQKAIPQRDGAPVRVHL